MGVLNVTPDSFSGDGIYGAPQVVARKGREMVEQGADLLDIGGESSRPGHSFVSLEEELERVLPAVDAVRAATDVPISVDTTKPQVAREALAAGATIVNDVSGLLDAEIAEIAAQAGAGIILVHHGRAAPGEDLMAAIIAGLSRQIEMAISAGVVEDGIVVDPGLGFGKDWRENFGIMRRLPELMVLGRPILAGPSRKGMIGRVLGVGMDDRLEGSLALAVIAIAGGADLIRVHDVREMTRAARMMDAIVRQPA